MPSPARLLPIFLLLFSQSPMKTYAECPNTSPISEFLSIDEEKPVGSTLFSFTADSGTSWTFPNMSDYFRQETHQNVVSIVFNRKIDMEQAPTTPTQFLLDIKCSFPNRQPISWKITLTVTDVNEFAPRFQQTSYSVNVSEDLDVGGLIMDFSGNVADPDNSHFPIQLEISGSATPSLFSLTSQTRIVLAGHLDYDSGNTSYVINVTARERPNQGSPEIKANSTLLTVHVLDVDDLSPRFSSRLYRLSLDEGNYNGDLRVTSPAMTAEDMDRGINAPLNFSLDGDPRFSALENGSVLVTGKFDSRVNETIILSAKAFQIDNPVDRYDEAMVFVTVNDVNDHSPVMSQPAYIINVSESITPSDVILTVAASDDDKGNNSVFEFRLNDTSAMFHVQSLPPHGQIFLIQGKQLDYETKTSYTFQVFAQETMTSEPHSSNASLVTVNVLDENDNTPVFSTQQYTFDVNKTAALGHVVGQVNATDRDSGENGRVIYTVVYGTSGLFHLKSASGEITLMRALSDSDVGQYTFMVKAEDSATDHQKRRQSTAVVDINVIDVNTAPPAFNQTSYHGNISEDAAVGALVVHLQATDPDSRDVSRLQFSLQSASVAGVFRLSPRGPGLCDLLLNGTLDRESVANYTLVVAVFDGLHNASTRITVSVLDVNDNDPSMTSLLTANVTEGRSPGRHVLTLMASDADAGENGVISFSMATSSQRAGLPFAVNATTGEVTTTAVLDRENVSVYTFYVTAKDGGTPPRSSVREVEVTVEDVNDNGPTFNQTSIVLAVAENSRPRYTVQARDVDLGRGGEVFYHSPQSSGHLVVNASTGEIMATVELPLGTVAYILVEAYNPVPFDTSCPHCRNATVNVTFVTTDINNNPPVFNASYDITVPEGNVSNPILRVEASDGDITPAFHDVRYWLSRGDTRLFRVDTETGDLYMTFASDFDPPASQRSFNLEVSASNLDPVGTTNASTPVVIRIVDVNDNAPIFTSNFIECNVSESTPARSAFGCRVNASDIDSGNNQKITYAFLNQNQHFTMNSNTGEITLTTALDYDAPGEKMFSLTASATDGGTPSLTSTARVLIRLQNENDNEPEWLGGPYSWTVQETSPSGAILGQVLVSDRDGDRLTLSLGNATQYFSISSDGILRSTRVLDLDGTSPTPSPLYVWVEVTDGSHINRTVVEVTVTPVNEFTPAFSQNYSTTVNESLECGKAFLTVEATDGDSGQEGHVTYLLLAGNSNNTFLLDPDTGKIALNCGSHLDASWRSEFVLSIMAKDGGVPPRGAVQGVVVMVSDQNTQAPRFLQSRYSASVRENLLAGTHIVQVFAVDADTPADHLNYTILSVSGGTGSSADVNNFTMTSDGWLLTNGILDADVIPSGYVIFSIGVNDGVFNATTVVNVTVEDMNDNPPEIILGSSSGNFSVPENAAVNHLVAQISATDRDRSNTGFTYWMTGAESKFRMNMSSGAITVRESLDRAIQSRYNVIVHVSDHGSPPLFAESDVVIDVTDSNRAPYFNGAYNFSVTETAPVGSIVGYVVAIDPDLGSSGRVSYSISNGSSDFIMENIAGGGVLKIARPLDFETHAEYILAVVATDESSLPRSATTTIDVHVLDQFEPPIWASPLPTVVLVKSASCQSGQLTVLAQDLAKASGTTRPVEYSLLNALSSFMFDQNSGRLQVNRTSVAEGNYTLLLQACNGDDGHLCSNATLEVLVTAENLLTFCPAFLRASVLENMTTGHFVADVNTTAGDGSGVTYTLRSSSGDVIPFAINAQSGVVTVNGILDREKTDSYTLFIDAISTSGQTAQAQIVVVVEDVLDSFPEFPLALYEGEIPENATDGTVVMERGGRKPLEVTATDRDLNVDLQYSLPNDGCHGCFSTPANSGTLTFRRSQYIDRENMTSPYLYVEVRVEVVGHRNLSAVTNVSVLVIDVNDNWPQFSLPVYHANISEGEGLGRPVVTVAASDRDQLDANGLRYSLQGCEPCPFHIDPVTGMVAAKSNWTLDRETTANYTLTVVVKDTADHTNTSLVQVKILDVNDNDPTFNTTSYNVSVKEGPDSRNWSLPLAVFDADENENANLSFSLKSGNNDGKFSLVTRGNQPVLMVQRDLDRETTPSYTLTVQAVDAGRTPRTGTCLVTVHVMDVNDETPAFSTTSYSAYVTENTRPGTSLVLIPALNATDRDSGEWGTAGLRFSLSDSTTFTINPRNATITVSPGANLDTERQMTYKLQVVVADSNGTGLSATANLTVTVNNENDETPQFLQHNYTFHVTENSGALTLVGNITATDADGDTVVYSLEDGGQGRFIIDRLNGELKVAGGIDRETASSFRLNISAGDGVYTHTNFTDVTVLVDDVNDNCPTFSRDVYEFDVAESAGSVVIGNVSASDPDFEMNGTVLYSMNASVPFSVDNHAGQMTTLQELDREAQDTYEFAVFASDQGTPPCVSRARVKVTVTDVNDHTPTFCDETSCNVTSIRVTTFERVPVGSVIALPEVRDLDIGFNALVTFTLTGSGSQFFHVNNATGLVTVNGAVDINALKLAGVFASDVNATLNLTLTARDHGSSPLTSSVALLITMQDSGVDVPLFNSTDYSFIVTEGEPSHSLVGEVQARMRNGSQATLTYILLTQGLAHGKFVIGGSTGQVRTAATLDREEEDFYSFVVEVRDGRTPERTAYTMVSVTVSDVNDNAPHFLQPAFEVSVTENERRTALLSLTALDPDLGENGTVSYNITAGNSGGNFMISADGMLGLQSPLDREENARFILNVVAEDEGTPSKSSTATVTVVVGDVNDNAPVFDSVPDEVHLVQNYAGMKVVSVTAQDRDTGLNGQVLYKLVEGQDNFTIGILDGVVKTNSELHLNGPPTINLTVMAYDLGLPPMNSTRSLEVNITSASLGKPRFSSDFYSVTVAVGTVAGTELRIGLTAGFGDFIFNITGGDPEGLFKLDPVTASLWLARTVTHVGDYLLTVRAHNSVTGTYDDTRVFVSVARLDLTFTSTEFKGNVTENLPDGTNVVVVDVNCTAELKGWPVLYAFVTPTDLFSLNSSTGVISTRRTLDREQTSLYRLTVSVSLAASTSSRRRRETNTVEVIISVNDVNDNAPSLPGNTTFGVARNADLYTLVGVVKGEDKDQGVNAELLYRLTNGQLHVFHLDASTGELRVAAQLEASDYLLTVTVTDHQGTGMSAKGDVLVVVLDNNERFLLITNVSVATLLSGKVHFMGNFSDIIGLDVRMESVKAHLISSGQQVDPSKSDLYFHAFDPNTKRPVGLTEIQRRVATNEQAVRRLFGYSQVTAVPSTTPSTETPTRVVYSERMGVAQIILFAVAGVVFVGSLIAIFATVRVWMKQKKHQERMEQAYKARMKQEAEAEKSMEETSIGGDSHDQRELLPRTLFMEEVERIVYFGNEHPDISTIKLRHMILSRHGDGDAGPPESPSSSDSGIEPVPAGESERDIEESGSSESMPPISPGHALPTTFYPSLVGNSDVTSAAGDGMRPALDTVGDVTKLPTSFAGTSSARVDDANGAPSSSLSSSTAAGPRLGADPPAGQASRAGGGLTGKAPETKAVRFSPDSSGSSPRDAATAKATTKDSPKSSEKKVNSGVGDTSLPNSRSQPDGSPDLAMTHMSGESYESKGGVDNEAFDSGEVGMSVEETTYF